MDDTNSAGAGFLSLSLDRPFLTGYFFLSQLSADLIPPSYSVDNNTAKILFGPALLYSNQLFPDSATLESIKDQLHGKVIQRSAPLKLEIENRSVEVSAVDFIQPSFSIIRILRSAPHNFNTKQVNTFLQIFLKYGNKGTTFIQPEFTVVRELARGLLVKETEEESIFDQSSCIAAVKDIFEKKQDRAALDNTNDRFPGNADQTLSGSNSERDNASRTFAQCVMWIYLSIKRTNPVQAGMFKQKFSTPAAFAECGDKPQAPSHEKMLEQRLNLIEQRLRNNVRDNTLKIMDHVNKMETRLASKLDTFTRALPHPSNEKIRTDRKIPDTAKEGSQPENRGTMPVKENAASSLQNVSLKKLLKGILKWISSICDETMLIAENARTDEFALRFKNRAADLRQFCEAVQNLILSMEDDSKVNDLKKFFETKGWATDYNRMFVKQIGRAYWPAFSGFFVAEQYLSVIEARIAADYEDEKTARKVIEVSNYVTESVKMLKSHFSMYGLSVHDVRLLHSDKDEFKHVTKELIHLYGFDKQITGFIDHWASSRNVNTITGKVIEIREIGFDDNDKKTIKTSDVNYYFPKER